MMQIVHNKKVDEFLSSYKFNFLLHNKMLMFQKSYQLFADMVNSWYDLIQIY